MVTESPLLSTTRVDPGARYLVAASSGESAPLPSPKWSMIIMLRILQASGAGRSADGSAAAGSATGGADVPQADPNTAQAARTIDARRIVVKTLMWKGRPGPLTGSTADGQTAR